MEEKVDIVALGELLIDFTEAGHSQGGRKLFEQNPGGAPVNMLTAAGKAGLNTVCAVFISFGNKHILIP